MNTAESKNYRKTMVAIHIAAWLVVILAPLTFFDKDDKIEADKVIAMVSSPLMMMAVFYTMYLYITPRLLFSGEKRRFWIYSITLIAAAGILLHLWLTFSREFFFSHEACERIVRHGKHFGPKKHMEIFFMLRNTSSMAIAATIAAMSRISMRWHSSEAARQKAEVARQEAELRNLRNQINPHFLLNTLNNIYALIAFDQDKAQQAILELSGMLRHMLYDNQLEFVNLTDEVKFMHSYINLMRIRIANKCDINEDVSIPEGCQVKVAPLIFISLIENAFKHGIAATGKSFINISISAAEDCIVCSIENSNHPKSDTDRSGHGIGLEQVEKRLELAYPGKYSWEKGTKENNTIYYSKITIYDTALRNN